MDKVSLMIGGDIVPTQKNKILFTDGEIEKLIGSSLRRILAKCDFRIFNLEVPITNTVRPIFKWGPNLWTSVNSIKGIKALEPSLLTLANNHIMDQGNQGFISTIDILKENEIPYVGAGSDIKEALKGYILEKNEIRIGVYACAENEFSIASDNCMGANPFDPLESPEHITELKKYCDYVIVLYHGGREHYRYPSPYLQKVCRKLAEKGADFVICQHSHCIGCFEEFGNSTIIYGQGNFIFDGSDSEYWKTSILLNISFEKNKAEIHYIPILKTDHCIRIAEEQQSNEILNAFFCRSAEITESGFIIQEYKKLAETSIFYYLMAFHNKSIFYRAVNKLSGDILRKRLYSKKSLLRIRNFIECEAHRELLLDGLKILCEEGMDYQPDII